MSERRPGSAQGDARAVHTATPFAVRPATPVVSGYGPITTVLAAILTVPVLYLAVGAGGVTGVALLAAAGVALAIAVSVGFGSTEDVVIGEEVADGEAGADGSGGADGEPGTATQDAGLEHCPRCGQTTPEDAEYCEDCTVGGSWRK